LGLSSTTDKQKEVAWRLEFEALGEQLVFENVKQGAIYNDEAKRQAALRWLSEQARLRNRREVRTTQLAGSVEVQRSRHNASLLRTTNADRALRFFSRGVHGHHTGIMSLGHVANFIGRDTHVDTGSGSGASAV